MKNKKMLKIVSLVAVIVLLVLGLKWLLTGETADNDHSQTNNPAKPQDELVIAFSPSSEPETGFDPTMGWGNYGGALFQSALFKRDKDMAIQPDLATAYQISADSLTWTVQLRDDVKFSDGEPFTAEDVVFTYQTAAKSGSFLDLNDVASVRANNDNEVVFQLKKPNSAFIDRLISLAIVPRHAYGENYGEQPVGTGPFKLVQWNKGQQMLLAPNPYYYGQASEFKQITVLWLAEDVAYAAAQAGEVDIAAIPATLTANEVAGMHLVELDSVDNRGIAWVMVPEEGQTTAEGAPIGNDVTSDKAIRQAIDMGINRELLIEGVVNGFGSIATSVADNLPWWNPELAALTNQAGDLEGAKTILANAGWIDSDGDGIREQAGVPAEFDLLYVADDQVRQALAITVADMVKELGIQINPVGLSWDEITKRMHADPVVMGWGGYDPLIMYNLYHSSNRGVEFFNTGFYQNSQVDKYLDAALAATSQEEANANWQKAQWDGETGFSSLGDVSWTWIMNVNHIYLVRDGLTIGEHKPQPHAHGFPLLDNIQEWQWSQ